MRAVSNTSPVSNLAMIGRLEVLRGRLGEIIIPPAVWQELGRVRHAGAKRAIEEAESAGWLKIEALENDQLARALASFLDPGESEAIALAVERSADLLVMDETAGRTAARSHDLPLTGTLGLLLKEKREGRILSLGDEMERLVEEAGFYLSDSVRRMFLEAAGEV